MTKLWDAWEPDAVVLDRDTPMFADGSKVHAVNHVGKYFRCRGPLNAPRSPQGRPPICQAGGSARGQDFAARWADTIITEAGSVDAIKTIARVCAAGPGPPGATRIRSRCCFWRIRWSTRQWTRRGSRSA